MEWFVSCVVHGFAEARVEVLGRLPELKAVFDYVREKSYVKGVSDRCCTYYEPLSFR
jgi:hypothetical protein